MIPGPSFDDDFNGANMKGRQSGFPESWQFLPNDAGKLKKLVLLFLVPEILECKNLKIRK